MLVPVFLHAWVKINQGINARKSTSKVFPLYECLLDAFLAVIVYSAPVNPIARGCPYASLIRPAFLCIVVYLSFFVSHLVPSVLTE
jgi:hypothetical protein